MKETLEQVNAHLTKTEKRVIDLEADNKELKERADAVANIINDILKHNAPKFEALEKTVEENQKDNDYDILEMMRMIKSLQKKPKPSRWKLPWLK